MRAYGWTSQGQIIDAEADELRRMAEWVASGQPVKRLVTDLNTRGVPTVSGGRWAARTITRALTAPRIVGRRQLRDGTLVDDPDLPAILDVDTWQKVQKVLDEVDRSKYTPTKKGRALLSGVLRCGLCGQPMYLSTVDYGCGAPRDVCPGTFIRCTLADAEVTEKVLVRITSESWRAAYDKVTINSADHYRQVIADAQARMVVLAEEFGGGEGNREAFEAGVAAARKVTAAAERDLQVASLSAVMPPTSAEEVLQWWWEQASQDTRREVIRAVVDHVVVRPPTDADSTGDRLTVEWAE